LLEESVMASTESVPTWETRLHVAGGEIESRTGARYEVTSPASGRHVATVADAGSEDVSLAAGAAAGAFDRGVWRRETAAFRATVLHRIAGMLIERKDRLALMESLCSGKPIRDCLAEVGAAARYFDFYAGLAPMVTGKTIPSTPPASTSRSGNRSVSWPRSCPGTGRSRSRPRRSHPPLPPGVR
jgi:aldehyde dehydrogenase (NAD+)